MPCDKIKKSNLGLYSSPDQYINNVASGSTVKEFMSEKLPKLSKSSSNDEISKITLSKVHHDYYDLHDNNKNNKPNISIMGSHIVYIMIAFIVMHYRGQTKPTSKLDVIFAIINPSIYILYCLLDMCLY
jgi:hypothetical protein